LRTILYAVAIAAILVGASMACSAQTFVDEEIWTAEQARTETTSSWFGETGLIVIPTADTVDPQAIQAHFHRVDREGSGWSNTWGANVGFTSNIEGGVTRLDEAGETVFQAKVNLDLNKWLNVEDAPEVAIGGRDIADQVDRALYVVISKELVIKGEKPAVLMGHLGFGDTSLRDSPLDGFFAGVDFVPVDFLRVQIEHDGENINAAARYWWSEWFCTDVGTLDGDFGWGVTAETKF